jgi:signal transduction histidine kinase
MLTMRHGVRRQALLAVALTTCGLAPLANAQDTDRPKQILVLNSTRQNEQFYVVSEREMPRLLTEGLGEPVDFYTEYFDFDRFPQPDYETVYLDLLRRKYKEKRFDLLLVMGDPAADFLSRNRDVLFSGTPAVFYTLSPPPNPIANSAGLLNKLQFGPSIELALALQPDLKHVYVVVGPTALDRSRESQARAEFRAFEGRVEFTYLSGLVTKDLEARLGNLPPHSAVYYVVVSQDGAGEVVQQMPYLSRVAAAANAPTYSWADVAVDAGIVGGRRRDQVGQMKAIATLALRVLRGERADDIPVSSPDTDVDAVDWRQLRRWRLDESRLPAGTRVMFREPSIWDQYQRYIVGAVVVMLAQTALIAGLLMQRRARQRAEIESQRSLALAADANRRQTMSALTSSIAHELGQPLGSIMNNSLALQMMVTANGATSDTIGEILSDIQAQGVRASQIIDRHRTMLKSRQLDRKPIDLHAVIDETLALVAHDLSARHVEATVDLSSNRCVIDGDQVLLQQVFVNLVMNAVDAMAETPPVRRHVTISSIVRVIDVDVAVRDTGPGLPAHILGTLFTPFVTTKANGLGIGLTIVRSIVDAHGGTIVARNNPEGGATFTVTLRRSASTSVADALHTRLGSS